MGNKFKFDQVKKNVAALKQKLPREIADESRSFFIKSFQQQGFNDNGVVPWENVQRRIPGTKAYKYPKKKKLSRRTKPILVNTGRLRGSIRITQVSFARSKIVSDVPYAEVQNKKRRFLGRSRVLDKRINALIKKRLTACFKTT